MILADKISQLRRKNGWSQEELAEKLGVSRQSVSKWESAQSVPDLGKVLQMSGIFGVSTDYLLKDDMEQEEPAAEEYRESSVRRVSMEEAAAFLRCKEVTARQIAFGVLLCILSPICLILLAVLSEDGSISETAAVGIGLAVLFLMVAAAVAIFITCGMKTKPYEYLSTEEIETDYGVDGMVREKMNRYAGTYTRNNVLGTCLCILAAVPLILSALVTDNAFFIVAALGVTLLLVGIGVMLFVTAGTIQNGYRRLLQEGEFSPQEKQNQKKTEAISTMYWLAATAVYLGYSFTTDAWDISWVIWPAAGILYAIVTTALRAFMNKK